MKTEIWLDTSALWDLEFRNTALRNHISSLLPAQSTCQTSSYILFELARGPLRHLIRLHNKAKDLRSLADVAQYIKNCNVGSQRAASTMLAAYEDFLRYLETSQTSLSPADQLESLRSWLYQLIRRRWKRASRLSVVNTAGCRADLPEPEVIPVGPPGSDRAHYRHDLPEKQCGQADNCRIIPFMRRVAETFTNMTAALAAQPAPDSETAARIPALRRLLAHDTTQPFEANDCYRCGDAIIAGEAPADCTILSKNEKHFRPLCASLDKPLISYKEPSPATRKAK